MSTSGSGGRDHSYVTLADRVLNLSPAIIVAAQTSGGSLGSLLAPAKIIVGCATVGLKNQEGQVLRRTLPWGLAITALLGLLTWVLC